MPRTGRPPKLTDALRRTIREMALKGLTASDIAAAVGTVSARSVQRALAGDALYRAKVEQMCRAEGERADRLIRRMPVGTDDPAERPPTRTG
jgi:hypothetical protein